MIKMGNPKPNPIFQKQINESLEEGENKIKKRG
jgi:hypothetical protein